MQLASAVFLLVCDDFLEPREMELIWCAGTALLLGELPFELIFEPNPGVAGSWPSFSGELYSTAPASPLSR